MILAKVVGSVWTTQKEKGMEHLKLLVTKPVNLDDKNMDEHIIVVDRIGAGVGETVLVTQGTPAHFLTGDKGSPIDAIVVGIVDSFELNNES